MASIGLRYFLKAKELGSLNSSATGSKTWTIALCAALSSTTGIPIGRILAEFLFGMYSLRIFLALYFFGLLSTSLNSITACSLAVVLFHTTPSTPGVFLPPFIDVLHN
jgi:ABC-type multidrug transport system permease subunit